MGRWWVLVRQAPTMQPQPILDHPQCFCIAKTASNGGRRRRTHFASHANGKAKLGPLSPRDSLLCGLLRATHPRLRPERGGRGVAGRGEEPVAHRSASPPGLLDVESSRSVTGIGHYAAKSKLGGTGDRGDREDCMERLTGGEDEWRRSRGLHGKAHRWRRRMATTGISSDGGRRMRLARVPHVLLQRRSDGGERSGDG
jgi:hypothetical protein